MLLNFLLNLADLDSFGVQTNCVSPRKTNQVAPGGQDLGKTSDDALDFLEAKEMTMNSFLNELNELTEEHGARLLVDKKLTHALRNSDVLLLLAFLLITRQILLVSGLCLVLNLLFGLD